jgi:hypothetical protein
MSDERVSGGGSITPTFRAHAVRPYSCRVGRTVGGATGLVRILWEKILVGGAPCRKMSNQPHQPPLGARVQVYELIMAPLMNSNSLRN